MLQAARHLLLLSVAGFSCSGHYSYSIDDRNYIAAERQSSFWRQQPVTPRGREIVVLAVGGVLVGWLHGSL